MKLIVSILHLIENRNIDLWKQTEKFDLLICRQRAVWNIEKCNVSLDVRSTVHLHSIFRNSSIVMITRGFEQSYQSREQ